jgi:hypothetical protein
VPLAYRGSLIGVQGVEHRSSKFRSDSRDATQVLHPSGLQLRYRTKVPKKGGGLLVTKSRNRREHRGYVAFASLTLKGDGEAMSLIANPLHHEESFRDSRQDDGEIRAGEPEFLEPLGDSHDGNIDPLSHKNSVRRVYLREAPVNDKQTGRIGKR